MHFTKIQKTLHNYLQAYANTKDLYNTVITRNRYATGSSTGNDSAKHHAYSFSNIARHSNTIYMLS